MTTKPLLATYSGEGTDYIPLWFMRQAGRYLPEYRALRGKYSMLELIREPALAAEVTLHPLKRFDLDGAIIFADILNPLIGFGVELEFAEGVGPKLAPLIRSSADIERLRAPNVAESLKYTFDALRIVRGELKPHVTLLGFAGAPFTLSSYLIEGGSSRALENALALMRGSPDDWHTLQGKLVPFLVDYLLSQLNAGADALQLFDSWIGAVTEVEFTQFVVPYLEQILQGVRAKSSAPLLYFSLNSAHLMPALSRLQFSGFSVDWRMSLCRWREGLGDQRALQGNLDPLLLKQGGSYLISEAKRILAEGKLAAPYVFNLGHGVLPGTDPNNLSKVIEVIRESKAG